jgi:hypothetical protein
VIGFVPKDLGFAVVRNDVIDASRYNNCAISFVITERIRAESVFI